MTISLRHALLPALALAIALFAVLAFTQTAYAQCPTPSASGGITVNHAVCIPAGPGICTDNPQEPGKDGCPCSVGGTQGGSVTAICMTGCCMRVSETSSSDAAQAGGLSQLGQMLSQALQQLMGGGGGGGGGGSQPYTPPDYGTQADDNLLSFDSSLLGNLSDAIFGGDNNSNDNTNSQNQNNNGTTNGDGSGTGGGTNEPGQEGDTVTTTYESTGTEGEDSQGSGSTPTDSTTSSVEGDLNGDGYLDDFERDYLSASLDPSDGSVSVGSGISLELLEAQGLLEAYRLGTLGGKETAKGSLSVPYESLTPAEIRTLQDYHSSAVAVSGKLSPFQEGGANTASETQGDGFFKKVARFFAALLGFGPPQN